MSVIHVRELNILPLDSNEQKLTYFGRTLPIIIAVTLKELQSWSDRLLLTFDICGSLNLPSRNFAQYKF